MANAAAELAHFAAMIAALPKWRPDLQISRLADHAWLVSPRGAPVDPAATIPITLMAVVHGSEIAGARVLSDWLAQVASGAVNLATAVAVILGNPEAALAGVRFLDRDLNRCFGRTGAGREERRAAELAPILARSSYLLDLHQTTRPSPQPFFIFPYYRRAYQFARAVAADVAVVTHWGRPFSAEGSCSDEYVISRGGAGVTLELGQNGIDPYQVAIGVKACMAAVTVAARSAAEPTLPGAPQVAPQLYTWAAVLPWPEGGLVELDPDLDNFRAVAAQQRLGQVGGQTIVAPVAGRILFPKYLTAAEQARAVARPTELVRILRPISEAELPADQPS